MKKYKKAAFTLAEVLITLAILGSCAALTLPSVGSHFQKKSFTTNIARLCELIQNGMKNLMVTAQINSDDADEYTTLDAITLGDIRDSNNVTPLLTSDSNKGLFSQTAALVGAHSAQGEDLTYVSSIKNFSGSTLLSGVNGYNQISNWQVYTFDHNSGTIIVKPVNSMPNREEDTVTTIVLDANGHLGSNRVCKDVYLFVLRNNGLMAPAPTIVGDPDGKSCSSILMQKGWQIKD